VLRLLIVIVVLLLTASLAAAAPRHHAPPPKCRPRASLVLAADPQAVVWRTPGIPGRELAKVYGCAYGHPVHFLNYAAQCTVSKYDEESCGGIDREVLAGPIVAYATDANSPGCGFCHWAVVVRDLRTGRTLRNEPTGATNLEENFGVGPTTVLVLKGDGAVAWIVEPARGPEGGYQVHAADLAGSRLLASGANIDRTSLALAGSTLYWTQGGKPYSAPLD
jgi:hypothetical protein